MEEHFVHTFFVEVKNQKYEVLVDKDGEKPVKLSKTIFKDFTKGIEATNEELK